MSEIEFERWLPNAVYSAKLELQQLSINPELAIWEVEVEEAVSREVYVFDCFAENSSHAIEQAQNAYPHAAVFPPKKQNSKDIWQNGLQQVNHRLRRLNTAVSVEELQQARALMSTLIEKGEKVWN